MKKLTDKQINAAAKKMAECMDYPWEGMPEQGKRNFREHAQAVFEAVGLTEESAEQREQGQTGSNDRPCHVFNVTKNGSLTEWEPTTMAFSLPDGKHALYTTPPNSDLEEHEIWPIVNLDVDEAGNITNAKLYSPGLPAGNHDVYPVRVPYMDEHTEAWLTVSKTLEEVRPGFLLQDGMNGIECAVAAIRSLATPPAGVPDGFVLVPMEPTDEMHNAFDHISDDLGIIGIMPGEFWDAMLSAAPQPDRVLDGWQPIETAPKRYHPPISTVNHHAPEILGLYGQSWYCVCSWGGPSEPWWIDGNNQKIAFQPTHWMPLPAAPQPEAQTQEVPQPELRGHQ